MRAETKKQLICNFKVSDPQHYQDWIDFKEYVKSLGLDVCRVMIGLANAFRSGEDFTQIVSHKQIIQVSMHNEFLYQVSKPRREPFGLHCVRKGFQKTFSTLLYEAYVLEKARNLKSSFCFRDFLELKHDAFRRILIRLKRKGKIIAHPLRTNPRFYILTERLGEYESLKILKKP